jgi:UDP-N-acetylglucosamine 2-epimerase (non-hydrolysing)
MMNKLIDIIVGARPNFIKVAAIIRQLETRKLVDIGLKYRLIHTSQHYDEKMSGVFFQELNIPAPDINLNVGSEETSNQIATIIARYSKVLNERRPDMVIVSGDVNSTVACALATKKTDPSIPLVHVEAGLRCGDKQMPEEINRILTDSITDYYFTTSSTASDNLVNEGIPSSQIYFVGNTMIDTLFNNEKRFRKPPIWDTAGLYSKGYYVLTLHRQGNISDYETLNVLLSSVSDAAGDTPIVFPVHPHTAKMIDSFGIQLSSNVIITEPLGYLEFNYLVKNASAVITDSGGISEETTIMNVPCMTLRNNTERPETCDIGTNLLLGNSSDNIYNAFELLKSGNWPLGRNPELWDGMAAERIVDIILDLLHSPLASKHNIMKLKSKAFGSIQYKTVFLN